METVLTRRNIDWAKTGKVLELLRADNLALRRFVCRFHNAGKGDCGGNCANCRFEMDSNISRKELADVFNVSESVVANWESAKTPVPMEDLLFYSDIAGVDLFDLLVFTT